MVLHYKNDSDPDVLEVISVLKEMALAYKMESANTLKLVDGTMIFEGKSTILTHLDSIRGELHQWYYCDC